MAMNKKWITYDEWVRKKRWTYGEFGYYATTINYDDEFPITCDHDKISDYLTSKKAGDYFFKMFEKSYVVYEKEVNEIYSKLDKMLYGLSDIKKRISEFTGSEDKKEIEEISKVKNYLKSISWIIGHYLDEYEQRIIAYRYFEGMTYKSIGQLLNIHTATVKTKLDKSMCLIAKMLYVDYDFEKWDI